MDQLTPIKEDIFQIPVEELFPKFDSHLSEKNNSRIFFSGKFGMGKTYFLNEFFEKKSDDYEVFHLFPVNYQINSNEDIIEFLKYDILTELLQKDNKIFSENDYSSFVDLSNLAYLWGKNNWLDISKSAISLIPRLGRPLKEIVEIIEKFWKFKTEMEAGEKGKIDSFLKEIREKNILETDPISELLKEKINKIRGQKESVLILDDLDRIDPEHIFRILNIFSAHFDLRNREPKNKFGFDKIILVGDSENIKGIFEHRYGKKADFNGYFDKFFSFEIFQFRNEEIISKFIDQIISKLIVEDYGNLGKPLGKDGLMREFLKAILLRSLKLAGKEKLNLRQLFKGIYFEIDTFKKGNYQQSYVEENKIYWAQIVDISIKALICIFGGSEENFLEVLKRIQSKPSLIEKTNSHKYHIFSTCFLKKIDPSSIKSTSSSWREYHITMNEQYITSATKNSVSVKSEDLFFDLIIEYVEREYYKEAIQFH